MTATETVQVQHLEEGDVLSIGTGRFEIRSVETWNNTTSYTFYAIDQPETGLAYVETGPAVEVQREINAELPMVDRPIPHRCPGYDNCLVCYGD